MYRQVCYNILGNFKEKGWNFFMTPDPLPRRYELRAISIRAREQAVSCLLAICQSRNAPDNGKVPLNKGSTP